MLTSVEMILIHKYIQILGGLSFSFATICTFIKQTKGLISGFIRSVFKVLKLIFLLPAGPKVINSVWQLIIIFTLALLGLIVRNSNILSLIPENYRTILFLFAFLQIIVLFYFFILRIKFAPEMFNFLFSEYQKGHVGFKVKGTPSMAVSPLSFSIVILGYYLLNILILMLLLWIAYLIFKSFNNYFGIDLVLQLIRPFDNWENLSLQWLIEGGREIKLFYGSLGRLLSTLSSCLFSNSMIDWEGAVFFFNNTLIPFFSFNLIAFIFLFLITYPIINIIIKYQFNLNKGAKGLGFNKTDLNKVLGISAILTTFLIGVRIFGPFLGIFVNSLCPFIFNTIYCQPENTESVDINNDITSPIVCVTPDVSVSSSIENNESTSNIKSVIYLDKITKQEQSNQAVYDSNGILESLAKSVKDSFVRLIPKKQTPLSPTYRNYSDPKLIPDVPKVPDQENPTKAERKLARRNLVQFGMDAEQDLNYDAFATGIRFLLKTGHHNLVHPSYVSHRLNIYLNAAATCNIDGLNTSDKLISISQITNTRPYVEILDKITEITYSKRFIFFNNFYTYFRREGGELQTFVVDGLSPYELYNTMKTSSVKFAIHQGIIDTFGTKEEALFIIRSQYPEAYKFRPGVLDSNSELGKNIIYNTKAKNVWYNLKRDNTIYCFYLKIKSDSVAIAFQGFSRNHILEQVLSEANKAANPTDSNYLVHKHVKLLERELLD